jgi:hypothetical protein
MAKSPKQKAAKPKTPPQILALWVTAFKSAIGSKTLDKDIEKEFKQGLLDSITSTLAGDPTIGKNAQEFDRKAEVGTKRVARDMGKVCVMLTNPKDRVISLDTFQIVFEHIRPHHPACLSAGGGAGDWCSPGG